MFYIYSAIQCPPIHNSTENHYLVPKPLDRYTYNMNWTAKCMHGYELSYGNLIRTCQENGSWLGQEPVCTSKYCYV